jgi:hypothetical protein
MQKVGFWIKVVASPDSSKGGSVELRFQGFTVSVQGFKLKNEFGLFERFWNLEPPPP